MFRYRSLPVSPVVPIAIVCLLSSQIAGAQVNHIIQRPIGSHAGATPSGPIGRPVLGFSAYGYPVQVRAIFGVPGSLVFGGAITLKKDITRLRIAPGHAYGIAERNEGDPEVLLLSGAGIAGTTALTGASAKADWVAFSPRGSAAILFSATRLQVIAGLPNSPYIARDADASAFVQTPLGGAISDDASSVILSSANAAYLLSSDGPRQIASSTSALALAFLPLSSQAIIGDRDAGTLALWDGSTQRLVASGLKGIGEIAATNDGSGVWVSSPDQNVVSLADIRSGAVQNFDTIVQPDRVEHLAFGEILLLSAKPDQPAWLFVHQNGEGRAAFVPAVPHKQSKISPVEVAQ